MRGEGHAGEGRGVGGAWSEREGEKGGRGEGATDVCYMSEQIKLALWCALGAK